MSASFTSTGITAADGTATVSGLTKATKWQRKFLNSNITTDTADVTDLKFSGLVTGKTYRISIQLYMDDAAGDDWQVEVTNNSVRVLLARIQQNGGTGGATITGSVIFTAAAATLVFATQGMGGGSSRLASGTGNTFVILEELPLHVVTTDFT